MIWANILAFLLRWWREAGLAGLGVLVFLIVPSYYRLRGELSACRAELAKPVAVSGDSTAKIRIVYRDKTIPCPDIEVDTTAHANVDGGKTAPQAKISQFSADLGLSSDFKDLNGLNAVLGVNSGPIRVFGECDLTGRWKVGGGYVLHFQGGAE